MNKPKFDATVFFHQRCEQVTRERAQSFQADDHMERVVDAYKKLQTSRDLRWWPIL
jgi:hypothetical protein